MLRSIESLKSCTVLASDGHVGPVKDLYFDDEAWAIRFVVVRAGGFFTGSEVLISPVAIERGDWITRTIRTGLTRAQIEAAPRASTEQPVSRRYEREYFNFYRWPYYWSGSLLWGLSSTPYYLYGRALERTPSDQADEGDPHLRSAEEVAGYSIEATDGELGVVKDFIADDETWAIRYLVVQTGTWFGKKVLVPPGWAEKISWSDHRVYLNVTQEQIRNSPEWDPTAPVNRELETRLYDYYGRPVYWESDVSAPITTSPDAPPPSH